MEQKKHQSILGLRTLEVNFGNKDQGEPKSFGEMLLSGKPAECPTSPHAKTQPRIRPRAKPVFGRRPTAQQNQPAPERARMRDRSIAVVLCVGLALIVGAALLMGSAFLVFGPDMI